MTPAVRTDIRLTNDTWEALMTAHATLMGTFGAENIWDEASVREYDSPLHCRKTRCPRCGSVRSRTASC